MRFLTMRHTVDKVVMNTGDHEIMCGPHRLWHLSSPVQRDYGYEAYRHCNGDNAVFTHDNKHNGDRAYGFLDWNQFEAYWGTNPQTFHNFDLAGYVVYEYDIPEHQILSDDTQAIAPIYLYEPVTAYTFGVDTTP